MAIVEGLGRVQAALNKEIAKARGANVSVVVGYTAAYAVYVHENLEARHKSGKQAKFLEQPARDNAKQIAGAIAATMKRTASMEAALLVGGHLIQRLSQKVVPVLTGNLKGSAFTKKE